MRPGSFLPKCVDAIFDAKASVVLREHGGRQANLAYATVDQAGGKTDGIEHGAAANGDYARVSADAVFGAQFGNARSTTRRPFFAASPPGTGTGGWRPAPNPALRVR